MKAEARWSVTVSRRCGPTLWRKPSFDETCRWALPRTQQRLRWFVCRLGIDVVDRGTEGQGRNACSHRKGAGFELGLASWQQPDRKGMLGGTFSKNGPPNPRRAFFVNGATSGPDAIECCLGGRGRESVKAMPAYHPQRIEPKWQAEWERNKTFRAIDLDPVPAQALYPRHVPLPQRSRPARRPSRGVHGHRHRLPLQADARIQRPAPDGLGRLRPARRAIRRPDQYASRGSPPRPTSTPSAARSSRSASPTTGTARSIRPTPTTTSGPSGSSSRSTTPGTTPILSGPIDRAGRARARAGRSPSCRSRRAPTIPTPIATPRRLAYRAEVPVNWCPELGTVLANEEVIDGKSERGGYPVVRMPLTQWMLRITAYAERLIEDLDDVDWPRPIKDMQRNWVGRSEGAEVDFPIRLSERQTETIRVFTTRPDTLFGATYMVLAPEHPLVDRITSEAQRPSVETYRQAAATQERPRPHRPGQDQDRRLHRGLCDQSGQRPVDPRLDRRLRSDGIRHRRDHGRPGSRRARLRVRPDVQPADRPRGRTERWNRRTLRSTHAEAEPGCRGPLAQRRDRARRPAHGRGQGRDHRLAGETRARQEDDQLQASRLAVFAPAVLGRAVSGRARRRRPHAGGR